MLSRRNLAVSFVAVLLLALLAGCQSGTIEVPDRDVATSMDAAMKAQEKGFEALLTGQVEWSEEEFTSLVNALLQQNLPGAPVDEIKAWFTDTGMVLQAKLADGTVLAAAGNVMVEDQRVKVDLSGASALGFTVSGELLTVVEEAINRALDDPAMGVAVGVSTDDGTLMVNME